MPAAANTIRVVAGDRLPRVKLRLRDATTRERVDLTAVDHVVFVCELLYAEGRVRREMRLEVNTAEGPDGLATLDFSNGELVGALPGLYLGEVQLVDGLERETSARPLSLEVRELGGGTWLS